jgi:hypothetical protein
MGAAGDAALERVEVVDGVVRAGGPQVEVRPGIARPGGLVAVWPLTAVTAHTPLDALIAHWRAWGLPGLAPCDHETRWHGPHQHPAAVGRVLRLGLARAVVPGVAPPRETGVQAAIAGCQGPWQAQG